MILLLDAQTPPAGEAIDQFDTALASHIAHDELPIRVNGSQMLAEALLARDGPGDRERAKQVADDAVAIADRIGIFHVSDQLGRLFG